MKKLIAILAVAGFSISAQAVSLQWAVNTIAFGGSTLNATTGVNLTAYLIYLGNGDDVTVGSSYTESQLTTFISSTSSTEGSQISGTNARGIATATFKPTAEDPTTLNGNVYGMLLTFVSEGKTYYNLSAETYKVTGIANETSTLDKWTITAGQQNYTTAAASSSVAKGGGWTAVPEPSTAALALAGLALLLKRRKA